MLHPYVTIGYGYDVQYDENIQGVDFSDDYDAHVHFISTKKTEQKIIRMGDCIATTALALLIFLSGCQVLNPTTRLIKNWENRARAAGFEKKCHVFENFQFITFFKETPGGKSKILHVYIEGDGHAWINKYQVSRNPTPKHPIALCMAMEDPHPNILYLGRPCQFIQSSDKACHCQYWTSHRYSEEVVSAINAVIDKKISKHTADKIVIVGYSGGGTIAALIAATRNDVVQLITVAANLDIERWASWHGVTPLAHSLNPINYAVALNKVQQVHLIGQTDRIVPKEITDAYMSYFVNNNKVEVKSIAGYNHTCCWIKNWKNILNEIFASKQY